MGVSIKQFYDEVKIIPPSKPILLIGDTGIGKTAIVRHLATDVLKMPFTSVVCSSNGEIVNLTGIPDITGDCTDYKPPKWYKKGTDQVVLLDEINRNDNIISALMELATDKTLGSMEFTPNSRIFAAMNPVYKNRYKVCEMDMANNTRFAMIELEPTPEEWVMFGREEHVHETILNYITEHPEDLDSLTNDNNIAKSKGREFHGQVPTRRGWFTFSEALYNAESFKLDDGTTVNRFDAEKYTDGRHMCMSMACGYVGVGAGQSFTDYYYSSRSTLSPTDILDGSDADWKQKLPDEVLKMCLNDGTNAAKLADNVCKYLETNIDKLWNTSGNGPSSLAKKYAINFYKYMYSSTSEFRTYIYKMGIKKTQRTKVKWPNLLCIAFPKLNDFLMDIAKELTDKKKS